MKSGKYLKIIRLKWPSKLLQSFRLIAFLKSSLHALGFNNCFAERFCFPRDSNFEREKCNEAIYLFFIFLLLFFFFKWSDCLIFRKHLWFNHVLLATRIREKRGRTLEKIYISKCFRNYDDLKNKTFWKLYFSYYQFFISALFYK